eukprot:3069439-Pyramimonas_sp.AAC.1
MEQKKAILILEEGKQAMVMPGGDYRIHVGPQAVVANLVQLPSGHLAMKCSEFSPAPHLATGPGTHVTPSIIFHSTETFHQTETSQGATDSEDLTYVTDHIPPHCNNKIMGIIHAPARALQGKLGEAGALSARVRRVTR